MAQFNDWSKSYQNSLGNAKMAAIRIAENRYQTRDEYEKNKPNVPNARMVDEVRNNHNDVMDSIGKFQQGVGKINEMHQEVLKRTQPGVNQKSLVEHYSDLMEKHFPTEQTSTKSKAPQTNISKEVTNPNVPLNSRVKMMQDPDTKYDPQVYKHVRDVPPLKPKSASFAERYANDNSMGENKPMDGHIPGNSRYCYNCGNTQDIVWDPSQEYGTGWICRGGC